LCWSLCFQTTPILVFMLVFLFLSCCHLPFHVGFLVPKLQQPTSSLHWFSCFQSYNHPPFHGHLVFGLVIIHPPTCGHVVVGLVATHPPLCSHLVVGPIVIFLFIVILLLVMLLAPSPSPIFHFNCLVE